MINPSCSSNYRSPEEYEIVYIDGLFGSTDLILTWSWINLSESPKAVMIA